MKTNIKSASVVALICLSIGCISVPRISSSDAQSLSDAELVLKYRELKQKSQEILDSAQTTMNQKSYRSDSASQLGHSIGQLLIMSTLKGKAENLKESAESIKAECVRRGINPETYPYEAVQEAIITNDQKADSKQYKNTIKEQEAYRKEQQLEVQKLKIKLESINLMEDQRKLNNDSKTNVENK
jgi:hypothetical protein